MAVPIAGDEFPRVFISKPLLCSSQAKMLFPLLSSLLVSAEEANPAYATGGVSGKVTVKEDPRPTRLSTATAPHGHGRPTRQWRAQAHCCCCCRLCACAPG